jgi:hypothetical protein
MDDIAKKMGEALTSEFAKQGVPPMKKYDLMRKIQSESDKGEKKHFTDFLKSKSDFVEVYDLIKNKKLSANQIRSKIKQFLNNPEDLNDFLQSMLDSKRGKKEESKEAASAGTGSGVFVPPLSGGEEEKIDTKNIPTVREGVLKGGKADNMTLLDIAKKHAYDDSTDSTTKEKIEKVHRELKSQLNKGIKTEMEHTKDKDKAKEIAMDHLSENPKYYDKLKKVETKEATLSSSSGQFSQPAIWAKSMSKKNWKGASTKYMPGAKRVQVKKKCKTFPYCNQGDIKALRIFESENVQNAIDSVSSNYGYNKEYISEIVFREIRKRQN